MDAATAAAAATAVTVKSNQRKKGMTRTSTLSQRVERVEFDRSIDRSVQTRTLSSGAKLKN